MEVSRTWVRRALPGLDILSMEEVEMVNRYAVCALLGSLTLLVGAGLVEAAVGVKLGTAKYDSLSSTILVDGSGRPLYHLTSEKGTSIRCSGGCAKVWPPVIIPKGSSATAGQGVIRAKLGTTKRPDGRTQLTYAGLALYRYASDIRGAAAGQGVGNVWYVVNSAGRIVTRAVADPTAGGSTGAGDTGGGSTGGGGGAGAGYGY